MKLAACFSGRTRNFEDTFGYLKRNFLDVYDVDIFIFGSPNKNGLEQNVSLLKDLYDPKKIIVNEHSFYDDLDRKYDYRDPVVKMWYNIFHADKLRREFEIENNFKYDYVFRMRFDFFFIKKLLEVGISLEELDDNSIFIPDRWNFSQIHPMAKTDMFAIGTSKSMEEYCNLFENVQDYINRVPKNPNGSPHPESLLGVYLNAIGLNIMPIESPFEFEYPEEIDIGSTDLQYRSNYRKIKFD